MRTRRELLRAGLAASVCLSSTGAVWSSETDDSSLRRLRFALTLRNPLDRMLKDQSFWCYLPANLAQRQQLETVKVSLPHHLQSDYLGHQILALTLASIPPHAQRIVTIETAIRLGTAAGEPVEPVSEEWLVPERYIEADNPKLRALAARLSASSPRQTSRAIYDWVIGNIEYAGYVADDAGALKAFEERRGDCTEFSYLLTALARASGIPSRMVGGYVVIGDAAPRQQDYHNWSELFFEGRWHIADAQKGNWLEPANHYIAFRIHHPQAVNAIGSAHRFKTSGDLRASF